MCVCFSPMAVFLCIRGCKLASGGSGSVGMATICCWDNLLLDRPSKQLCDTHAGAMPSGGDGPEVNPVSLGGDLCKWPGYPLGLSHPNKSSVCTDAGIGRKSGDV